MTRGYLDSIGIKYNYLDVDKVEGAGVTAVEKSGQRGIPVIDIDGDLVVGFDRPTIDHLLKTHKLA